MISVPKCELFKGRKFQYGPSCAVRCGLRRFLVYYPLGSGKTLSAIHGARVFLDKYPKGKIIILTTLSNIESTWKKNIKMYLNFESCRHKKALKDAEIRNIDWWYSLQNERVSHYNDIMNHLTENGFHRYELQQMSSYDLLKFCKDVKVRRKFSRQLRSLSGADKQLSMLSATVPNGKYCLIVDECQQYIHDSANAVLVNKLATHSNLTMLLSATPVHDSYHFGGLRRLLGNPSKFHRSFLFTDYHSDVSSVNEKDLRLVPMTSDEWRLHNIASSQRTASGFSENAYLTKSRQSCNCDSKWSSMASQIESDIISSDSLVRIVVFSFFRLNGVDGFFHFLNKRWSGSYILNKRIHHKIGKRKIRVSKRHQNTLKRIKTH